MSKLEKLNNVPGVKDLNNENAETVSGGRSLADRARNGRRITGYRYGRPIYS